MNKAYSNVGFEDFDPLKISVTISDMYASTHE
jgi:hypothetical protein